VRCVRQAARRLTNDSNEQVVSDSTPDNGVLITSVTAKRRSLSEGTGAHMHLSGEWKRLTWTDLDWLEV
jgi:hypothetical protein